MSHSCGRHALPGSGSAPSAPEQRLTRRELRARERQAAPAGPAAIPDADGGRAERRRLAAVQTRPVPVVQIPGRAVAEAHLAEVSAGAAPAQPIPVIQTPPRAVAEAPVPETLAAETAAAATSAPATPRPSRAMRHAAAPARRVAEESDFHPRRAAAMVSAAPRRTTPSPWIAAAPAARPAAAVIPLRPRRLGRAWRTFGIGAAVASMMVSAMVCPVSFAPAAPAQAASYARQIQTVAVTGALPEGSARAEVTAAGPAASRPQGKFANSVLISGTPSQAEVVAAIGLPVRSTVPSLQDDYPYAGRYGGTSPFGYAYGNCTDFAGWRVNRDAGDATAPWRYTTQNLTPMGGNGGQWSYAQNLPGWGFGDLTTVKAGDLISFPMSGLMGTSRTYGHVAYVSIVFSDGSIVTENYGDGRYFLEYLSAGDLQEWLPARGVVIRTHP